jgi:hypothetical protein
MTCAAPAPPCAVVEELPPVDFGLGDPFEEQPARRVVGVCGACGGPLVSVPFGFAQHGAMCPCGRVAIPAAFTRAGMTSREDPR